jgi:hypothetical protein
MYAVIPYKIKHFSENMMKNLPSTKKEILPGYLASLILNNNRKVSLTGLGKTILESSKFKTTVSLFFKGKRFYSRKYYLSMVRALLMELKLRKIKGKTVLIIDGCCTKRGANTLIENANQYRKKQSNSKSRSTKSHMFVKGLVILPNGLRIPAPRYSYYTKGYCKKYKLPYKTQHQLAAMMIEEVNSLFKSENLVVIADGFFDSQLMFSTCRGLGATFIVPADSARIYIKKGHRRKLHKRAYYRSHEQKTFGIQKGDEKFTKEHSRYHNPGAKKKDFYKAKSENLEISGLGDILVTFSWKKRNRKYDKRSLKVLLCSNPHMSTEEILELYALRWQIEIFFRELKSDLGLSDFSGRSFKAFERYVDLILMSYLFLEWYRLTSLKKVRSMKDKGRLKKARTRFLISCIKEEATSDTKKFLLEKVA